MCTVSCAAASANGYTFPMRRGVSFKVSLQFVQRFIVWCVLFSSNSILSNPSKFQVQIEELVSKRDGSPFNFIFYLYSLCIFYVYLAKSSSRRFPTILLILYFQSYVSSVEKGIRKLVLIPL